MAMKYLLMVLLGLSVASNFISAIQCDFKYEEVSQQPANIRKKPQSTVSSVNMKSGNALRIPFSCEDDDFETIVDTNVSSRKPTMTFDTRLGPGEGDDEYESAGSDCVSSKKTITPKSLNNVYNDLMEVVNNATFVQSIQIEMCQAKNSPCNNGYEDVSGKMLLCRQKYVKIILKAFKGGVPKKVVDEEFYYPSNCICELVQRKNSAKRKL